MLRRIQLAIALFSGAVTAGIAQGGRHGINLNGTWDFEQTKTAAVPAEFTRRIPVPGLIHLAEPKIDQYDHYFTAPREDARSPQPARAPYEPRYYWYRRTLFIPKEHAGKEAFLTLLKSQFVTQAFVNGMDVGRSIACATPLDFHVTSALRFGGTNEILVRVGDHEWLPSESPGGVDNEKTGYAPGIWDDVELTFTGRFRIHRALVLPSLKKENVLVKLLIRCISPARTGYGVPLQESFRVRIVLKEKNTGKQVGVASEDFHMRGGSIASFEIGVPLEAARAWSPDDPFLYVAETTVLDGDISSDTLEERFGMRDFERTGKYFSLNGERIMLRGANITLHRFFNDPDCGALPWNREWVRKLLGAIPKELHWNAMRNSIGLLPDFWYDIADEVGLMLQNEWMYWQAHGWDRQTRIEFSDWVWADGSHPSIVIWDAMNEHQDNFIGNVLIPELKQLDPTRIWDNGYMTKDDFLVNVMIPKAQEANPAAEYISAGMEPLNITWDDDMDEMHPYLHQVWRDDFGKWADEHHLLIGDLDHWSFYPRSMDEHSAAQLVNEYGWLWLWRNGFPSPHSPGFYEYYLGGVGDIHANRELQAYDLQWETELFRSHQSVAGLMAFAYLTNNYGATGDWFTGDIQDLTPGPTLLWFRHCFAPAAVFINLADQRYNKNLKPCEPGSHLVFNLVGVNDRAEEARGTAAVRLLDEKGVKVASLVVSVAIPEFGRKPIPVSVPLPAKAGGYLLVAEFAPTGAAKPVLSRRYLKIGEADSYAFFELQPEAWRSSY